MTEFIISVRVRTDREPKDDLKWEDIVGVLKAVFKTRPAGEVVILGLTMEQVQRGSR
jgi:hypothetical protein